MKPIRKAAWPGGFVLFTGLSCAHAEIAVGDSLERPSWTRFKHGWKSWGAKDRMDFFV